MKKFLILVAAGVFLANIFSSCFNYHDNDVSISIQEDEEEYKLSAHFEDRKTKAVQNFIKEYTASTVNFKSKGNNYVDATVTLDDNTKFYIKSYEGRLKIKFDKEQNSEESYEKIKEMCEGVKDLLAQN
ncbi:hypothetical protein [Ferruginibacter sp.]